MNIKNHVKLVGWFHIANSALVVFFGLLLLLILIGIGVVVASEEPNGQGFLLSVVGISMFFLIALLALPGIIGGIGVLKRKGWARIVAIIVGILNLFNIPVGTALGIYTLWVLFKPEAIALFAQGGDD